MFKTPILFLIFNRPDTTREVFNSIRAIKPTTLFIAADGARNQKEGEKEICEEVKKLVLDNIDWNCEVKTLFREQNLGCARAVSEAITWFFGEVEQGIILEDDCLPHPSFYAYCEELLHRYKEDSHVWSIGGNNFQNGIQRGKGSYYFSQYVSIWGWATWRRAWQHYDLTIAPFDDFVRENKMDKILADPVQKTYWENAFRGVQSTLHTWDYQWVFTIWNHGGINIFPNVNLIENIGFSNQATHTFEKPDWYDSQVSRIKEIGLLKHPETQDISVEADNYLFYKAYGGKPSLFTRIKKRIRRMLKGVVR